MLKGFKSVNLKIIQMYHFRLKWKRYTVCTDWWDSNFFWVGLPLFPVGLLLFARWESWTPVFKILVRALNMHVIAAYLMCIHIFAKIVRHVGGHLGFLEPHHDSSQSPSIFLHLRYVSHHLWNNFLWTSHAHRHPLKDCIKCWIGSIEYTTTTTKICFCNFEINLSNYKQALHKWDF